jgi:hypothetical protein
MVTTRCERDVGIALLVWDQDSLIIDNQQYADRSKVVCGDHGGRRNIESWIGLRGQLDQGNCRKTDDGGRTESFAIDAA